MMTGIIEKATQWTLTIVSQGGYGGVFLLSLLDRVTVFLIPAEVALPVMGILVSQGKFGLWSVMFWMSLGSFIGNILLYCIFFWGGRTFLEKYGKYFLISKTELTHFDRWFAKYGDRIVVIGYLIPTSTRSLVPIAAGISRMSLLRFSLYSIIAFLPLNILYVYAGVKVGDNLDLLNSYLHKLNYLVIVVLAIFAARLIYRHRLEKHSRAKHE